MEGKKLPFSPIYLLLEFELYTLREYFDKHIAKGLICPSTSPAGSLIHFVKKKDDSLYLCVNYRGLNTIIIKNQYPLCLILELFDRLRSACYFTKFDIQNTYN